MADSNGAVETPPDVARLWERMPGEPIRWFARFDHYRLMGSNRTMLGCVREMEEEEKGNGRKSKRVPGFWVLMAEKWRWKERVAAYDTEQIRLAKIAEEQAAQAARQNAAQAEEAHRLLELERAEARRRAVIEMNDRHAAIGKLTVSGAGAWLRKILTKADPSVPENVPPAGLTVSDLLAMLRTGIATERQALGEPLTIEELRSNSEVSLGMAASEALFNDLDDTYRRAFRAARERDQCGDRGAEVPALSANGAGQQTHPA